MNLKQLREFINSPAVRDLSDDTAVGAVGHHGQFCEANEFCFEVQQIKISGAKAFTAVIIDAIDIGPEPD